MKILNASDAGRVVAACRIWSTHTCKRCGTSFEGVKHARFCSTRCRVAWHRAQRKQSAA